MKCLSVLMENEAIQSYIQEREEVISTASEYFGELPQEIKSYVQENLSMFIDTDVKTTFENIRIFTEAAVCQFLDELTNQMVAA